MGLLAEEAVVLEQDSDSSPMKEHLVCRLCYPEVEMGIPALCGEKVLGLPPAKNQPVCEKCADPAAQDKHLLDRHLRGNA